MTRPLNRKSILVRQIAELVIELLDEIEPSPVIERIEVPVQAPAPNEPMVYRVKDASRHLGISQATLYRLIATGRLQSLKIDNRRLIERVELERFIALHRSRK